MYYKTRQEAKKAGRIALSRLLQREGWNAHVVKDWSDKPYNFEIENGPVLIKQGKKKNLFQCVVLDIEPSELDYSNPQAALREEIIRAHKILWHQKDNIFESKCILGQYYEPEQEEMPYLREGLESWFS